MQEFFRGWKRKVGVVTLVMACLLAGAWMRSFELADKYITRVNGINLAFESSRGAFGWQTFQPRPETLFGDDWASHSFHMSRSMGFNMIPYGFIVTPLSLLSIWLLLSKPRMSKPKPSPEP